MNEIIDGTRVLMDPVEICRGLNQDTRIGFDTETTGLIPQVDRIAVIQLYGDKSGTLGVVQVRDGVIPSCIMELFTDRRKLFIGHNVVNFDLAFLHYHGVEWWKTRWYDTLVGETVIVSTGRRNVSVSLRESARRRLGLKIDKDIAHGNWGAETLTDKQIRYAARDVLGLPALMDAQIKVAEDTKQLEALEMEQELMPSVAWMYINGLPIDMDTFKMMIHDQEAQMNRLELELQTMLGRINFNSPAQVKRAVREKAGVDLESTAKEYLIASLSKPFAQPARIPIMRLLEWRKPAQIIKMYGGDWADKYIINGRVHAKFWQCSADTSRFTCSGPNLQQWPKTIRYVVGNIDGVMIVANDYSQIEVRLAAEIAGDRVLMDTLNSDDVHTAIASQVYKIPEDKIAQQQRKNAKALTFALLFDGTPSTLHRHSITMGGDLTYQECEELERQFFHVFKGLEDMRRRARGRANRSPGPVIVRLPNGLRRILAGQNKTASRILNTMVQGSAAVGIKHGIIDAAKQGLVEWRLGGQIHDELVGSTDKGEAKDYAEALAESMIRGMNRIMKSTVKVEQKVSNQWEV